MMDEQDKRERAEMCVAVGDRVWNYRKAAGLSREELAERLNVSTQYISDIEQGKKCMSSFYFRRMGRIFNVSLDELANGQAQPDAKLWRLIRCLMEMKPVDREVVIHLIQLTAETVKGMGRED